MSPKQKQRIKEVKEYLGEKQCRATLNWFKQRSNEDIKDWLETYKSIFDGDYPPTVGQIRYVEKFYKTDNSGRLALQMDNKKSGQWQAAFDKVADFFPTLQQYNNIQTIKASANFCDIIGEQDKKLDKAFRAGQKKEAKKIIDDQPESATQYLINNDSKPLPIAEVDEYALDKALCQLPFYNHQDDAPSLAQQYETQAKVLIELYPYRKDIVNIIPSLNNMPEEAETDIDYSMADNLFKEIIKKINTGLESGSVSNNDDVIEIFKRYKVDFVMKKNDKKYIKRYAQYDDKNKTGISKALKRIFDYKFAPQVGNPESIKTYCNRKDIWES